jgi:hypothetical protein
MKKWLLAISTIAMLSACGDKKDEFAVEATPQSEAEATTAPAKAVELPQGDKSKPLDQYVELNSGAQLSQAYYAFSGLPVPYEKLAEQTSVDYRQTQDSFKKQDILKVLQPQMEQELEALKKNPYLMLRMQVRLKNYDMQRKGFPIQGFDSNGYISYRDSDSVLTFSNTDDFQLYAQQDETKARELEAQIVKQPYEGWPTRAYFFVQDAKDLNGRRTVRTQLLKLVVETPEGQVLFEM